MAARQSVRRLRLVVTEGPSKGAEFNLERRTTGVGRDPKNQVVIDSQSVSLFHASITSEPRGCTITNLGSLEGVKLNGKNVDSALLSPGDRLQLGNVKLRVEASAASGRAPSAKSRPAAAKTRRKRGFSVPLKPSFIILFLLSLLAVLVMLNLRWFGVLADW